MGDARRAIPGLDRLLASAELERLAAEAPRARVVAALQRVVAGVREELAGAAAAPGHAADPGWYAEQVRARLAEEERPSLRPVINATGVVLHTNLGRAPLADAALAAIERAARGYTNLEYELDAGERGSRYVHCAALLRELTGAEDALVVNNNAAAVVLALNTLAEGREAVISRGELVEIGGSFRVPEIMARSGARMVEVGSTNRTHPEDYRSAIGAGTGVVLKVHRSNFRITGYVAEVGLDELVSLAGAVPVVNDLGSGLLLDPAILGLPPEPTAGDALRAGAAVVTLSGDKLLGGPQAGILLGRADLVARMRRNPLCRALRVDKLTLAALEATLALYREPERALREIPVLRMLSAGEDGLRRRALVLAAALGAGGAEAEVVAGASRVGGGAFPEVERPTALVAVRARGCSAAELAARLRAGDPPVVARVADDRLLLDPRTVAPAEEPALTRAVLDAAC